MNKSSNWIQQKMRLGWLALLMGLVVGLIGLALERMLITATFNVRIITGVGILLIGVGAAYLLRYGFARGDENAARRVANEERDERLQLLRARAGQRAYWVSALLTYALLMWSSFADGGGLPALSGDLLWFALAGAFLIPVLTYIVSIVRDQNTL